MLNMPLQEAMLASALVIGLATLLWWIGPARVIGFVVFVLMFGFTIWALVNFFIFVVCLAALFGLAVVFAVLSGRSTYGDRYR